MQLRAPILLACIARMRRLSASVGWWSRARRFDSCIHLPLRASAAHASRSSWPVPPDHRKSMGQLLLIALATFVSEDLTCIATGALVASGALGFLPGVLAC